MLKLAKGLKSKPFWKRLKTDKEVLISDSLGRVAEHFAKNPMQLVEALAYGGVGFLGARAGWLVAEKHEINPVQEAAVGAVLGMIALKLATAPNMVASAAGLVTLSGLGVTNLVTTDLTLVEHFQAGTFDIGGMLKSIFFPDWSRILE